MWPRGDSSTRNRLIHTRAVGAPLLRRDILPSEGDMEAIIGIAFLLIVWAVVLGGSVYFNQNVK